LAGEIEGRQAGPVRSVGARENNVMELNIPQHEDLRPTDELSSRLNATRDAFDSVAVDYDGPRGNNELIQDMRHEMWRTLDATFAPGAQLMDIGCGTGLDAVRMARIGHHITATDWSPRMVARTQERAEREQLQQRVQALAIGAQELARVEGRNRFDGAYSDLGALNCVPNLPEMAAQCARLLKPGGMLVFSVIGRFCPWEIGYYASRWNAARIRVRFAANMVPVNMNKRVVWTNYYSPREFYRAFKSQFVLTQYRGLCVFAPPPYLTQVKARYPRLYRNLWRLDRRAAGWPLLRNLGDHFLMIMRKR
jgi:ubiquinone/menaquinone biosynthesis C-methylase UbiE